MRALQKGIINHPEGLEQGQTTTEYDGNRKNWYVYAVGAIDTTGPYMHVQEAQLCECNYMQIAILSRPSVGMNENKRSTSNTIYFY